MIISDAHKYIFIAVPKTGTSSISQYLLENDLTAKRNEIIVNGETIKVPEHITANKLKDLMGESFDNYKKICFLRDPFSKVVSSYYFYKKGRVARKVSTGERRELKLRLITLSAKIIPFPLWALLYPYRTSSSYIADAEGDLLVDYIGCFKRLEEDFYSIFQSIRLNFAEQKMKTRNITEYKRDDKYFSSSLVRILVSIKLKEDLQLYRKIGCDTQQAGVYQNIEKN